MKAFHYITQKSKTFLLNNLQLAILFFYTINYKLYANELYTLYSIQIQYVYIQLYTYNTNIVI